MTFDAHVDAGQLLIMLLISAVGYFVKREINNTSKRLDRHDEVIFDLTSSVQRLIGYSMKWNGITERRKQ